MKDSLIVIIILIVALCGFGGGLLVFGLPIIFIFKLSGVIAEIISILTIFVPMPIAWYLAPKLSDKYL